MITFSAPGKICLFGEHGIVYGTHSIACSIDRRSYVSIERSTFSNSYIEYKGDRCEINNNLYIFFTLNEMKKIINLDNFLIKINSNIPMCSGLGSSSAVVIALIGCINKYYDCNLNLNEIANIGYKVEKSVQGLASPMDTYISTFGGVVMFPEKKKINPFDWDLIICNSMDYSYTKSVLNKVNILKSKNSKIIKSIFNTIDLIAIEAEKSIIKNDIYKFSQLMNINQGLLDSIGVNSKTLSSLVYDLRNYGAFGSKITGAGCGGCIFSVAPKQKIKEIVGYMNKKKYETFICNISNQGLRDELEK